MHSGSCDQESDGWSPGMQFAIIEEAERKQNTMKAAFSEYLNGIAPLMKDVIARLACHYDYISVLSTDTTGFSINVSQRAKSVENSTMFSERGTVIRVRRDGLYSEYAFNQNEEDAGDLANRVRSTLDRQLAVLAATNTKIYDTAKLSDEPIEVFAEMETEILPEEADLASLIEELSAVSDAGIAMSDNILDCMVRASSTHVNKMFLTEHRDMRQSYVYSEGSITAIAEKDGRTETGYTSISGRRGPELFRKLREKLPEAVKAGGEILSADRIVPGEYDVITAPEVTGLIAHEAFGHGVEMDMFVKNRALGEAYIGRRVASDVVTMHEGALCAEDVASYAFDDEGTLAGDTVEIEHGILRAGICDALSAVRLGTLPTGNGKRESFEHKVYTRMTNTVFDSGTDRLEDMIASVSHGYLLEGMSSGMEDPKHWGIQCIIERGYEIKDGKLTGKVAAPIVMTGYVPELLGSISMASTDREVFGSGACGKGHKEWVKVSDGGPYLKAKARLG